MLLKVIGIICDNRGISVGFKGFDLDMDSLNFNGNTRYFYDIPANKVGNYKYENIRITNTGIDFLDGSPSDLPVYDMNGKRVQNKNVCILLYKVLYNGVENSFIVLRADNVVVRLSRPELLNVIQKVPFYNVECSDSRIRARKGSIFERNFAVPTKKPVLSPDNVFAKSLTNSNNVFKSNAQPSISGKQSLGTDNIFKSNEKPEAVEKSSLSSNDIFKSDVKPEVEEKSDALSEDSVFTEPSMSEAKDSVFTELAMSENLDADSVFSDVDTFENKSEYPKRFHFDTITVNEAVTSNVQLFGYDTDVKYYPIMQDINSSEAAFTKYKGKDLCLNKAIFEYKDLHAKADSYSLKAGKYVLVSYTYDPLSKGESNVKDIKLVDKSGNTLILNTKSELRKIEEQGQLRNAKVVSDGTGIECDSVLAVVNYENCSTFPLVHDSMGNIAFLTKDLNPQTNLYIPHYYILGMTDNDLTYIGIYIINRFFKNYITTHNIDVELPEFKWSCFEDVDNGITNCIVYDDKNNVLYIPRCIRNNINNKYVTTKSFYMLIVFAICQYLLRNTPRFNYYNLAWQIDRIYTPAKSEGRAAIKSISLSSAAALMSMGYTSVNAMAIEKNFSLLNSYGKENVTLLHPLYKDAIRRVLFMDVFTFSFLDLRRFYRITQALSYKDYSPVNFIKDSTCFDKNMETDYSLFLTKACENLNSSVISFRENLILKRGPLTRGLFTDYECLTKKEVFVGLNKELYTEKVQKTVTGYKEALIKNYEEVKGYYESNKPNSSLIDLDNLPENSYDTFDAADEPALKSPFLLNLYSLENEDSRKYYFEEIFKLRSVPVLEKGNKSKICMVTLDILREFVLNQGIEGLKNNTAVEQIKDAVSKKLYGHFKEDEQRVLAYMNDGETAYLRDALSELEPDIWTFKENPDIAFMKISTDNKGDFTDIMYKINLLVTIELAINLLKTKQENNKKVLMLENLLKAVADTSIKTDGLVGKNCEFIYSLLMLTAMLLDWGVESTICGITVPFDKVVLQIMLKPSYDNILILLSRLYPYLSSVYRRVVF